ncbi:hypothetical protein PSN45_000641 [Yamadazyma tenuis]|uniref:uncharacterized protein n=1 Tax=Candida tenuis TaxID=2315449 RepID=UPI002797E1F7|nr:hypothetical protein PSN45_000641 [Yamadazyma tenuis]
MKLTSLLSGLAILPYIFVAGIEVGGCDPDATATSGLKAEFFSVSSSEVDTPLNPSKLESFLQTMDQYSVVCTGNTGSDPNFYYSSDIIGGAATIYSCPIANTKAIGVRLTGYIYASESGTYTISAFFNNVGVLTVGDGNAMSACCSNDSVAYNKADDNWLVSSNSGVAADTGTESESYDLKAGYYYPIKIVFYNGYSGDGVFNISMVLPDGTDLTSDFPFYDFNLTDNSACPIITTTTVIWTGTDTEYFTVTGSDGDVTVTKESYFIESYFIESYFIESYFIESYFIESYFIESYFIESYFIESYFIESYFIESYFIKSYFIESYFIKSYFIESNFIESNFIESYFIESYFIESNFIESYFIESYFIESNFQYSNPVVSLVEFKYSDIILKYSSIHSVVTATTPWTGSTTSTYTTTGTDGKPTVVVETPVAHITIPWTGSTTSTYTTTGTDGKPTVVVETPVAHITIPWTGSTTSTYTTTGTDGKPTVVVETPVAHITTPWTGSFTSTYTTTGTDGKPTVVVETPVAHITTPWTGSTTSTYTTTGTDGKPTVVVETPEPVVTEKDVTTIILPCTCKKPSTTTTTGDDGKKTVVCNIPHSLVSTVVVTEPCTNAAGDATVTTYTTFTVAAAVTANPADTVAPTGAEESGSDVASAANGSNTSPQEVSTYEAMGSKNTYTFLAVLSALLWISF